MQARQGCQVLITLRPIGNYEYPSQNSLDNVNGVGSALID
jgi:hypothetical protein